MWCEIDKKFSLILCSVNLSSYDSRGYNYQILYTVFQHFRDQIEAAGIIFLLDAD